MAIAVNAGTQTTADELRTVLAQSEGRLVKLRDRESAMEFFAGLDTLVGLWPAVQEAGVDARGERSRWETLQAQLKKRGGKVLAAWGGRQALSDARAATSPERTCWWWWLDEIVAEQRRNRLLKTAGVAVTVIAIAALGAFLFDRLLPVDESVRVAYSLRTDAESAILIGDYESAFNSMKQAALALPEDPSLRIMVGVLAEQLGDATTATQAWDRARSLLQGKEADFLMRRGMAYGQTNQFEKSKQDELAALALDPTLARAYLYLGAAYEGQDKIPEALDAYTKASELAGDVDAELTVLVRIRMASLLQRAPLEQPTGASP